MRHCCVLVAVIVVAVSACKGSDPKPSATKPDPAPSGPPAAGQAVAKGQVKRTPQEPMFAVIARDANLDALDKVFREQAAIEKLTIETARSTARDLHITRESMQYMFGGVPAADFEVIERGSALMVSAKQPTGIAGLRGLAKAVAATADAAHGWVVDPGVGGLFTATAFRERIPGATPDARKLIAVHGVSGEEQHPFLDTMGMTRLGLPELYVAAVAPGQVDMVTQLINATAQTLIARGDITRPGELDVDLAQLDGSWHLDEIKQAGGTGRTTWRVRWTKGDEDESDITGELSLELVPKTGSGTEGIASTLDTFFGKTPDPIAHAEADDPELLAAASRARKELVALREHFAKGVPPGEQLIVKAPFKSPEGETEWMWVDVIKWRGGELSGSLDNEPAIVTSLHVGSQVKVKLSDVADYLHVQKDGTSKGGYSVEILRKRGALP